MNGEQDPAKPTLREKAEAIFALSHKPDSDLALADIKALHHHLAVHQIELELQNEELRCTQHQMELARDRYARLYHQAPVGYLILDANGVIQQCNHTFADLVGMDGAKLSALPLASLMPSPDREIFLSRFKAFFRNPEGKHIDVALHRKNGIELVVRLTGRIETEPLFASRSAPIEAFLLIGVVDITEQNRLEEERSRAHGQTRSILESISDAFFSLDHDLVVTYFNAAAEKALGRKREEVLGRPLIDVFPEAGGNVFEEQCTRAAREKTGLSFETHFGAAPYDNWYDVRVYPYDQGISVYLQVVTARKQAELALKNSLLEKEALLKEVHHRVKNNLQIVSSLLRMQSSQNDHPALTTAFKDMQNRVRSMALIHEHLYRSPNLAHVDLSVYLKQLCVQLFRSLVARQSALRLRLEMAPVQVTIDQAVPCGLLVNELISNALKHAFRNGGPGEVLVELQPVASNQSYCLSVTDDGVGLPAGFVLEQSNSLGLRLVTDLARQIGGQANIIANPAALARNEDRAGQTDQAAGQAQSTIEKTAQPRRGFRLELVFSPAKGPFSETPATRSEV